ncbi:6992_t:CDS:2 [Entrophospora sp. SA101]|nr:6992_t:CDS:2 [Entrophospora sp. SA101]
MENMVATLIEKATLVDENFLNSLIRQQKNVVEDTVIYKKLDQDLLSLLPSLEKEQTVLFPKHLERLVQQYSMKSDVQCLFGCFENVDLAYFVINYSLFIWEYGKDNQELAIGHLEVNLDEDKIIKSVGIFKPKPNSWVGDAQYVLVVVTDKSIYVFGLSIKNNDSMLFHILSSVKHRASYSGKDIGSIVGMEDGRIFLIDNGELCELVYEESIPSRFFNSLIRPLVTTDHSDFKLCVVDETRNMIYAMSEDYIQAYYVTKDKKNNLVSVGRFYLNDNQELDGTFISICPILNTDSPYFWLLAITNRGYRGYFTCYTDGDSWPPSNISVEELRRKKPNGLYLVESHKPPEEILQKFQQKLISTSIKCKYFHKTLFIIESDDIHQHYQLSCIYPNHGLILKYLDTSRNQSYFSEYFFTMSSKKIYDIKEIYDPLYNPKNFNEYPCDLISQYFIPSRKFLFYTSEGIEIWTKKMPVEQLKDLFAKNAGTQLLNDFRENYQHIEICSMCFLLTNDEDSNRLLNFYKPRNYHLYFGFVLFLSRTLRPIWKKKVLRKVFNGNILESVDANIPKEILVSIENKLKRVKRFCDNYSYLAQKKSPPLSSLLSTPNLLSSSPSLVPLLQILDRDENPSTTQQQKQDYSFPESKDLDDFLCIISNAISFIILMIDYGLSKAFEKIPESSQKVIIDSTYDQLILDEEVRKCWHDLPLAIIKRSTNMQSKELYNNLKNRCGMYCDEFECSLYEEYRDLDFYEGAMDLLITELTSTTKGQLKSQRNLLIRLIIDTLKDAENDDKELIFVIYDEFLKSNTIQKLFDQPTPSLQEYLKSSMNESLTSIHVLKKTKALSKFCIIHHQYIEAAEVLIRLAETTTYEKLKLHERTSYLIKARQQIINAIELYGSRGDENSIKLNDLLERYWVKLSTAHIQSDILKIISGIPENDYNTKASPAVLEKIWRKIMENAVNVAYATGSLEPISIKIIEAGLKLLLDEIVYLLYKWIDDKVESKDMDIRKMLQLISKYEHAASSYHRIFQQDLSFKFLDIQQKLENIEMKSYLYTS